MRHLLTLAAAASLLAACHNRSEDEVGAAPDRGDTTAVATPTKAAPTDSTTGQVRADTTAVQPSQDAGMSADTTAAPMPAPTADTTSAAPAAPAAPADTTAAAPADSTKKQ